MICVWNADWKLVWFGFIILHLLNFSRKIHKHVRRMKSHGRTERQKETEWERKKKVWKREKKKVFIIRSGFNFEFFSTTVSPSRAWNLTHTCPAQGVAEGSDLTCHCKVAGDTGSPNATVLWGGTGNNSDQLTLRDVTRADTGRQFECRLLWNGTVLASVTYVLTTFCKQIICFIIIQ